MPTHILSNAGNLQFQDLAHSLVAGDFVKAMSDGIQGGIEDFVLDFSPIGVAFPNACAPLAGLIRLYQTEKACRLSFVNVPEYVARTQMLSPRVVADNVEVLKRSPLNTVWTFENSTDVSMLTTQLVQSVAQAAPCGEGVLQALEWSINEVMDNVLQHSLADRGYVMGQIHKSTHHVAICVFDYGQGIYRSLRASHPIQNAVDAIKIAVQEGVTRDKNIGQGNGLWGLRNIVLENIGMLTITSGAGQYLATGNELKTLDKIPFPDLNHNCTTVDFQLDYSKGVAISKALGGFEPTNLRIELAEDNLGNLRYPLREKTTGTGTRQSGEALRNEVINMVNETQSVVVLDFEGITVISSSFADEFVGKLVANFGFVTFMSRFRLMGMNSTVAAIVNRSVAQRIAEDARSKGEHP